MLGTSSTAVRTLGPADLGEVLRVLDRTPYLDVFVASRVHASGLVRSRLGGELWGYYESDELRSLCYSGANLVPVAAEVAATRMFADLAGRRGRQCSSIVGPADAVLAMWDRLRPDWGPAREVRSSQLVMATHDISPVAVDPKVRRVRPDEIDVLMPAAVAMFTEEVGVPPTGTDGGAYYRARMVELVRSGRAFARFDDGAIVFKAEVGAVTPRACQVQGVWVHPERRGEGLSVGGMAAVVAYALREIAPAVSLYVNDFNVIARETYRRVGFTEIGRFATVMF